MRSVSSNWHWRQSRFAEEPFHGLLVSAFQLAPWISFRMSDVFTVIISEVSVSFWVN